MASEIGVSTSTVKESTVLRERYFGSDLELKSHEAYAGVWDADEKDTSIGPPGGGVSFHIP